MSNKLGCPHCKKGILEVVSENEPYSPEHYQCSKCDSTYPIDSFKLRGKDFPFIILDEKIPDPHCDWCGSVKIEKVGEEYNGWPILVCLDCNHEFYAKTKCQFCTEPCENEHCPTRSKE